MGLFNMISNAGSGVSDMAQSIPGQIAEMPSNAMGRFGNNIDFIKALTQDPEEFEKFMMENPDFLGGLPPVGIPELPGMNLPMQQSPGLKINQMPNFLNSAQQVLTGGY
tara:strand:+ start:468 stop:794 length:327 start_codon:yes stop_codon:yes gene_type:complete